MSRRLLLLRDLSVGLGLALVLLFTLPCALWQLSGLFAPNLAAQWPVSDAFFASWDGGAQQPMARALLRSLCALVALMGLLLPPTPREDGTRWQRPGWTAWGLLFLGLGALSALQAPHRFQALREWETWLAAGLLAATVAGCWRKRWDPVLPGLVYGLTLLTLGHALCLSIPGSWQRPGGFFHHPNAFSTFCLMLATVTFPRSFQRGRDARLAQICSGALLGLILSAGSLTGGALLGGLSAALAPAGASLATRAVVGAGSATLLVAANLWGGWSAILALPSLLALAWLGALWSRRRIPAEPSFLDSTILIVMLAAGVVALGSMLAPPQTLGQASASRHSSSQGRLELYRASLSMAVEHPLLGTGPAGFSREFPALQTTAGVFSKFPHSLPLEIAAEWGLPAFLCLTMLLLGALRAAFAEGEAGSSRRVCGWVLIVFLLHASTDVQTQFPYLLVLAAFALGRLAHEARPDRGGRPAPWVELSVRAILCLACLALLAGNLARVSAGLDRTLATRISGRAETARARQVVKALLGNSFQADPLDSESARLLGLALFAEQDPGAADMARLALQLDPNRASCRMLWLSAAPPAPENAVAEFEAAIATDRVNYPTFYRWLAEALCGQGKNRQALTLLRDQARIYDPALLASLFSFREEDLADQLVEFHALKALLEEQAGGTGEPDLRLALQLCRDREHRLRRLREYLAVLGDALGIRLPAELQLLLDQVPATQIPAAVKLPPQHP